MTIVHIAFQYGCCNTGGAAIAASRLHCALLASGVESHYICLIRWEKGENIHELPCGLRRKLFFTLTKFFRGIWRLTPIGKSVCLNIVPLYGLEKLLRNLRPDVVHVHWINLDVVSFAQLGRLPYPVVFNLHDLFPLIGLEFGHPTDERYIEGYTQRNSGILERFVWNRKRKMVQKLRPSFVGPSKWVAECCRRSLIARNRPCFVVSNLVDEAFRYDARRCVRNEKFVMLFGAYAGTRNPFKGWDDLVAAFNRLPLEILKGAEVWVVGESAPDSSVCGMPLRFLGAVNDAQRMCDIYHQADLFVFPSKKETQGMMKIEALLCGLPVVAFDRTGCAEGVEHNLAGWIAHDVDEFAQGISSAFFNRIDREKIAERAREMFSTRRIVDSMNAVYSQAIERRA